LPQACGQRIRDQEEYDGIRGFRVNGIPLHLADFALKNAEKSAIWGKKRGFFGVYVYH
jgi:hypothetical protein